MNTRKVNITKLEIEAIIDAVDFIMTNTDIADDRKPFEIQCKRLYRVVKKWRNRLAYMEKPKKKEQIRLTQS